MSKPLQLTRYILSAFILLCGIFTLGLWVFDFRFEQQEIHLMELELAVGLLLSGSILLLDLLNRHRLVIAGAVVQLLFFGTITGLMLLTPDSFPKLLEVVFSGHPLIPDPSPFNAVFFVFLSLFFLSLRFSGANLIPRMIAVFCLVTSGALFLSTVLDLLIGINAVIGFTDLLGVSPINNFYFLILITGAYLMARQSPSAQKRLSAWQLAAYAAYGVSLVVLILAYTSLILDRKMISEQGEDLLEAVTFEIRQELDADTSRIRQLAEKWRSGQLTRENLLYKAGELPEEHPSLAAVYLRDLDSGGTLQVSPAGTGIPSNSPLSEASPAFNLAITEPTQPEAVRFLNVAPENDVIIGYLVVPLTDQQGRSSDCLVVRIVLSDYITKNLFFQLWRDRLVIAVNGYQVRTGFSLPEGVASEWGSISRFSYGNLEFEVQSIPKRSLYLRMGLISKRMYWLFGISAALLTWLLVIKAETARRREKEALHLSEQLSRENELREAVEQDLLLTNTELERSNIDLQEFAQVASHDLQEPLRKIHTFAMRLVDNYRAVLDERGQDYLDRMVRSADRMSVLIDDLLRFARVQTKAQPLGPVDLDRVIQSVVDELDSRIQEAGARVAIEKGMPQVMGDASQLGQVFQNLIGNALKFSRKGVPPEIRVSCLRLGNRIQVTVADNGIGIDKAYLKRIFKVFERLHSRSDYEGTGIGLAIVKRIIDRHSGEITVESTPGSGSRFIMTLNICTEFDHTQM
jgi:signal transduction histidine kinase